MTELQRRIDKFRLHLMLRLAGWAALLGLLVALLVVIFAPWLRDGIGLPGYWLTIALPLAFPLAYVFFTLLRRPDDRTVVLAADAWCRAEGSIISAWELEREHPDSPFNKPVADKAVRMLDNHRLPEPPLLRKALLALLVMLALLPLSRFVYAQMQESEQDEQKQAAERKVDTPPEEAEKLAQEAAAAAERAKQLGAKQQEQLADDLEQAARNAQAGGQDKERALRDANSLVDRAKAQTEAQQRREEAREALAESEATRDLAEAIQRSDHQAARTEIEDLVEQVYNKDGRIDPARAEELRQAVQKAREQAPQDARLRRAAETLEQLLEQQALEQAQQRREQTEKDMRASGMDPEAVKQAMEKLQDVDERALARALEELAKAASPLRDLDVSGREMEELLKQLEAGKLDPSQAEEMAEAARQLSERLELDAETLREMLKDGREFEGAEEDRRRDDENMPEGERPTGPDQVPEWARQAMPEDWKQAWKQAGEEGREPGKGTGSRQGSGEDGREGPDGGKGAGEGKTGDPTRPVEGGGIEEGVETSDTGQGEKDPDKDPERLDPNKAGDEKARREGSGRSAESSGLNTRDEEERLPRRYREAARKYFER
ncbi:MAG: hypothetical protein M5U25_09260 [Planctomycetota bacterium]|nr:hypothetical protein [Planctomycetota bacterium]